MHYVGMIYGDARASTAGQDPTNTGCDRLPFWGFFLSLGFARRHARLDLGRLGIERLLAERLYKGRLNKMQAFRLAA